MISYVCIATSLLLLIACLCVTKYVHTRTATADRQIGLSPGPLPRYRLRSSFVPLFLCVPWSLTAAPSLSPRVVARSIARASALCYCSPAGVPPMCALFFLVLPSLLLPLWNVCKFMRCFLFLFSSCCFAVLKRVVMKAAAKTSRTTTCPKMEKATANKDISILFDFDGTIGDTETPAMEVAFWELAPYLPDTSE